MDRYLQRKYNPAQTQKTLGAGGRDRRRLEWRVKWGQRGLRAVWFACVDMFGLQDNILPLLYLVLLRLFVLVYCITKTSRSLLRNDCCEKPTWLYSRIKSVQLEY